MRNLLTIILAFVSFVASAETFTLQQCIDTAVANNIALLQQKNTYATAGIQYKQSLANISPNISAGASNMWSFGRSTASDNITYSNTSAMTTSFNLNASLVLFDGLAMKFAIDEARASMLSSEASIRAAELQLRLNISSMYLQVLLNKQILLAAQEQADDTQRLLRKDSLLVQANRLAEGELYGVIAQLGNEQLQVVQAQNDVQL
jgi:outer membrane protein